MSTPTRNGEIPSDADTRAAFEAGYAHGKRTDLPARHNVLKFASDRYPDNDWLFEAFMQGHDQATLNSAAIAKATKE